MSETFIQDRCAIFLADLPRSIDGDKISRLHMAYGLPMPVDFQLLHDSTETQASCAAIFRYADPATADGALEVFSGLPVEYNGRYWPLRAKLAGMKIPDGPVRPKEMPKAPVDDPIVLLREVPADWSQQDLMSFHLSLGMEEFQSARMMPSSDGGVTRHAYLQYRTPAAASNAVRSLSGNLVHPRSGEPRRLVAGLASDLRQGGPAQNGRTRPPGPGQGKTFGYRNQAREMDPFEAGPHQDPYTLYLSDMPSDFNKQDLERLHDQLGITKPKSIKVLYLRLNKNKSSAVLRYDTMEQAKGSLMVLKDRLVLVNEHSGEQQLPRAQFARKRALMPASSQDDNSYGGSDHEDRDEDDTIYALPSVYVAELPINITENGVRHMVQEVGGKLEDLVAVTFLQQKFKGSHACCLLRYQEIELAESMADKLHGFRVYHPDDRTRPVRAKVAKHSKALNYMCTDVYVGEVPPNWTASYMYKFLTQAGVERNVIHSVKLLSQRPGWVGVGAILHIVSAEAADRVVEQLNGQEILVRGKPRPLKVRLADAPKEHWMPEQPEPSPQPFPPAPETRKPAISVPVPLSQLQ